MAREPILVVDDNAANSFLAATVLETNGYEVRTAKSVKETREVLAVWHPRLILMDIQLPDGNGLQLTQELKAASPTSDIVIVALTAFAMKGDAEKALAAGCNGYISKPIDTRALGSAVAGYLGKTG